MRPVLLTSSLLIAGLAGALGPAGPAAADKVFHTTRYPLTSVGGSGVSGTVIDIHANGQRIYAQERYQVRGAVPGATYAIQLRVFGDAVCSGAGVEFGTSPTATANRAGNANARRTFAPMPDLPRELFLRWVVVSGSMVVAQTGCATVALD